MTVLTIGTFDILHPGHIELLKACRAFSRPTVVGLNGDAFVQRFKGTAPVLKYFEREQCLLACRYVDQVAPNWGDEDASKLIRLIEPSVLAVGSDWQNRDYMTQLGTRAAEFIADRGIRVVYVPRQDPPKISSSIIKARLRNEDGLAG